MHSIYCYYAIDYVDIYNICRKTLKFLKDLKSRRKMTVNPPKSNFPKVEFDDASESTNFQPELSILPSLKSKIHLPDAEITHFGTVDCGL